MYKISANELYHHGILGMKWGEQNGPPYPLGASQHSKKERSKGTSGWTRNAKQEVKSGRNKNSSKSSKSSSTGSKSKKSGLTDKQKKAIKIGATIAVLGLATYGAYKLSQSGALSTSVTLGENFVSEVADTPISELTADMSAAMEAIKKDTYAPGVFDHKQVSKLTDAEVKALRAYTTPMYKEANEYLRSEDATGTVVGKMIGESVKSALNKVSISKDVDVQRGIDGNYAKRMLGEDVMTELSNLTAKYDSGNSPIVTLPGIQGVRKGDNGVMSTAIPHTYENSGKSHSVAETFGKDGVVFDIKAQSGSKGMYISPISELQSEREVVFAPGSDLVLTGSAQLIDGIWHLGAVLSQ